MSIIAIIHIISIIAIIPIIVIMYIIAIMSIIITITIVRIIVGFQGWDKGTLKGLVASDHHSRSREQEQYTSIPDWIGRDNESTIIDTRQPYHDEVQSMTTMEQFRRKQIAVYSLHTFVLGVSELCPITRQLNRAKCPLHWADSCSTVLIFLGKHWPLK